MRNAVTRFQSVVRGNAKALPFTKLNLTQREALKRNLQIARPALTQAKVIVPHFPGEKVRARKGGIEYISPEGIRRLELPSARTDTIGHFFSDLKKNKIKLPDRRKGQRFGARYFTGRTQLFDSFHDLLNTMNTYDASVTAEGRKQTLDVIRNIEIFTVPIDKSSEWRTGAERDKAIRTARKKAKRRNRRK